MVIWQIEGDKGKKVVRKQAEDLLAEFKRRGGDNLLIEIVGRVRDEGYSYDDIDFEMKWKGEDKCKEFAQAIDDIVPPIAIDMYCKDCGAVIFWREGTGWIYRWNPSEADTVKKWKPGMRGITVETIGRLEERIERIEKYLGLRK